ncbi:MAG TPA: YceI family protein [Burkholderiales bacterium]|nr:YceI family protein [Burkholderiales bacterium]
MLRSIALAAALAPLPALADECYSVDAAHGSVRYEVKQAGSAFRGAFRRFGGEICLAADRATRIEVWLDPASADSGLPEIDAALKGEEFFAVERYPRVAYASRSIELRATAQLAHGTLQMKGQRRDLDALFNLRRDSGVPVVSGTLAINRLDYGIGTGEWSNTNWLGGEVKIDFEATLSRR